MVCFYLGRWDVGGFPVRTCKVFFLVLSLGEGSDPFWNGSDSKVEGFFFAFLLSGCRKVEIPSGFFFLSWGVAQEENGFGKL